MLWLESAFGLNPWDTAEFSLLSRIVCSLVPSQLPMAILGSSQTVLRVFSDGREDDHRFLFCREFTTSTFLECYRHAHQKVFGMLEVVTMVEFLMLRLKNALQEPWMEDTPQLRRCVVAGHVVFDDLRCVVRELVSVWDFVRDFTASPHIQSSTGRVSQLFLFAGHMQLAGEVLCFVVIMMTAFSGCFVVERSWLIVGVPVLHGGFWVTLCDLCVVIWSCLFQMRGTNCHVYAETTNKFRLGLLLHILDLCTLFLPVSLLE